MGWCFRRSVNLGPFRINLSKSGVGYSIGGVGFRVGKRACGRAYTSVSVPGTGLRYEKTVGSSKPSPRGCLGLLVFVAVVVVFVQLCGLFWHW
jgi:hypothetical protein